MTGQQRTGGPSGWRQRWELHFSNPAKSGPPSERPLTPLPPSPRRRVALLVVGIIFALTVLGPAFAANRTVSVTPLTFSSLVHNVQNDRVVSAVISPTGAVTGTLKGGRSYSSQIPVALQDNQLTGLLERHGVTITGVGSGSSLLATLLSFLPLLFIVGIFLFIARTGRSQMSKITGIGSSRAKLYDLEKPMTRFTDRRGWLRRGQARDRRGGGLPQGPHSVRARRGHRPPGSSLGGASRNGQDAARSGRGR
jgi:hypothetical protein